MVQGKHRRASLVEVTVLVKKLIQSQLKLPSANTCILKTDQRSLKAVAHMEFPAAFHKDSFHIAMEIMWCHFGLFT